MPQPDPKWDRLKDLFAAASAVPPEEREAFLRERGVGDATMREVLDLLGASSPLEEQAGDLIGSYKLLECLGSSCRRSGDQATIPLAIPEARLAARTGSAKWPP
ncbi:MAG: hypothetical protein IPK26_03855 [Planctomycetes bacterium]|nr:hypothetical protein [Planctomycetota bacterium]